MKKYPFDYLQEMRELKLRLRYATGSDDVYYAELKKLGYAKSSEVANAHHFSCVKLFESLAKFYEEKAVIKKIKEGK